MSHIARRRTAGIGLSLTAVVVIAGVITATAQEQPAAKKATGGEKPVVNDKRFHKQLLDIAGKYEVFGPLDDKPRFAPTLCAAAPPRGDAARAATKARTSRSEDKATHGQKLYFLYPGNADKYKEYADKDQPVGQVLVKESWEAAAADATAKGGQPKPAKKLELFIMAKHETDAEGTDEGWVYGTVTADGKTVTSAGKVASCANCHRNAKRDRVFGIPLEAPSSRPKPPIGG